MASICLGLPYSIYLLFFLAELSNTTQRDPIVSQSIVQVAPNCNSTHVASQSSFCVSGGGGCSFRWILLSCFLTWLEEIVSLNVGYPGSHHSIEQKVTGTAAIDANLGGVRRCKINKINSHHCFNPAALWAVKSHCLCPGCQATLTPQSSLIYTCSQWQ